MQKLFLLRSLPACAIMATAVNRKLSYTACNLASLKMKVIPVPPIIPKTYLRKNEDLKRVLSPHLSIYKTQITSLLSISLRMTGLVLGFMAWVVGLTEFSSAQCVDYFVNQLKRLELNDCYWTAAKIVVVFPFAFHYVVGIRHLMFDTSKLLEKPQFYATGYAAVTVAFILALCLGMIEDIRNKLYEMKLQKATNSKK